MTKPLTLLMPLAKNANLSDLVALLEEKQSQIDQALTSVGTVHYARFVLLDCSVPNLQPSTTKPSSGPFVLGVITEYDGDFDVYIQDFVNKLGPIFDKLLGFTADGANLVPVEEHVQEFTKYVATNDLSQHAAKNLQNLYSAYPYSVAYILARG